MKSIAKIEAGVASYFDAEVMPKLPSNGIERILTGTAISLLIKKFSKTINETGTLKTLGVQDEKGNVDVDAIAEELKKNMPKDGVRIDVPVIGVMTFNESDINVMLGHINKQ